MDNLAIHKCNALLKIYEELNVHAVLNVLYEPAFMPIETVFAIVKNQYKKDRLHLIANKETVDERTLIRKAFKLVKRENIMNAVKACMKLIGVIFK